MGTIKKTILVTGGAGYIGSHTIIQLLQKNYDVVIYDNLSNSNIKILNPIQQLTQRHVPFVHGDIRDRAKLRQTLLDYKINAVMHFAGLKAVGESEQDPLRYYDNNVLGSIVLIEEIQKAGIDTIIFSSSATVYGDPGYEKYTEQTPTQPSNVYGRSKLIVENILKDLKKATPSFKIGLLRYFNPVGAHESGLIGEDPRGVPNNLMPFIAQVAIRKREKVFIFGNDYPTNDGTGERDYIHVVDLARGHVEALRHLEQNNHLITVNLGTGRPYSVLELIHTFEEVSGQTIPYEFAPRRAGDLAKYYADPNYANDVLSWTAQYDLRKMCQDTWSWQQKNPAGYA